MSPRNPTQVHSDQDVVAIPEAITDLTETLPEGLTAEELEEARIPIGRPIPFRPIPLVPAVSGLYAVSGLIVRPDRLPVVPIRPIPIDQPIPRPMPGPIPPRSQPGPSVAVEDGAAAVAPFFLVEELRLDVDGRYPQNVASGFARLNFKSVCHWIANVKKTGPATYSGAIWYKDGDTAAFPYTAVTIDVTPSFFPEHRSAKVMFTAGGSVQRVRTFKFKSPFNHSVNFEFDCAQGTSPTLQINTGAHPNRPASISIENLSVREVYRRAGFDVTTSPGGPVAISGAGADAKWSDQEMHDAMQTYWSRFKATSQWAMWVFFASLHESGTSLGGIMFDDIGPQHRQGTAIFADSFIKNAPPGDPAPAAWVQRMIFWTACHEMGHAFNLAHSWQKALTFGGKGPWIPITNEPEARSFMNYPYNVSGGQSAFFADFPFRFTDSELLFLRHAPGRFVQMGNADWFDNHGFEEANVSPEPTLVLEVRVNRDSAIFEFLEPVNLELKLTNASGSPQVVDEDILFPDEHLTVIIKKDGRTARELVPIARYCREPARIALMPTESIYRPLAASAGLNGWEIDEPGNYLIQVALQLNGEDIVSNALRIRVAPPREYDEEFLAQEYFTGEVARTMILSGSEFFERATDTLTEITGRLPDRNVALHAALTLGHPLTLDYKRLVENGRGAAAEQPLQIKVRKAQPDEAKKLLTTALTKKPEVAIETLGHISYRNQVEELSSWLVEKGSREDAVKSQDVLYQTLAKREIRGRKILESVLEEVRDKRDSLKATRKK